jgi:GTP-binding protein
MKVSQARFVTSIYNLREVPKPRLPEIVFSGRSNVGKSSLINVLLGKKKFAKTSSTPGRTQSINFMEINSSLYFVDLPGYGYAKVPIAVRKKWGSLIEGYLSDRPSLRLLILLVDVRRKPQDEETLFAEWLKEHEIPLTVIVTKIDKVAKNNQLAALRLWGQRLNCVGEIIPFSAVTGEGTSTIWKHIEHALKANK